MWEVSRCLSNSSSLLARYGCHTGPRKLLSRGLLRQLDSLSSHVKWFGRKRLALFTFLIMTQEHLHTLSHSALQELRVSELVLWAQSTTKDCFRAEHKLQCFSQLFISQVIIPQVMCFEPIYIPRALITGTCLRQGDLSYSAGLHRNHVLATANTGEIGRCFGKQCRWMDWKGRNKQGRNPWQ